MSLTENYGNDLRNQRNYISTYLRFLAIVIFLSHDTIYYFNFYILRTALIPKLRTVASISNFNYILFIVCGATSYNFQFFFIVYLYELCRICHGFEYLDTNRNLTFKHRTLWIFSKFSFISATIFDRVYS